MRLASAIAFQGAWFSCVLGAARGWPWLGPAIVAALSAIFLALTSPRAGSARLLLVAALLGLVVDGGLVAGHALAFTPVAGGPALLAPWMVALWVGFATTLPWSMDFLRGRPVLSAILGAILGPMAYWAGARLGAISLGTSLPLSLGAIALGWGLALPALVMTCDRLVPPQPGMK